MKNTIRIQRAIKEISQQELANILGLSRQTINAIELKKYTPSLELAFRMAKYFGKPVEEVFIFEDD